MPPAATTAALLGLRDELAVARDLVVAGWLAAQAPAIAGPQRGALCAVTDIARDRLEEAIAAIDELLIEVTARPDAKAPDE